MGRTKGSYAGAGEADPRCAAEGEALAAGKRAAALAGRSARGTVRRLGRKGAKAVAEAREERSRARAVGRRGPRTPTETGRGAGISGARGDGRQEAPSGTPRLARGRGDRGGVPVSQSGREAAKGAALSSLGALALALVVIVALAGLIASSPFGIFFSGGDMGDGNPTLREAISGLNEEHQARIDRIAAENPHDELIQIQSSSRARSCHGLLNGKAGTDFSVGPGLLCGSVTVFMRKGRMLSALKIKTSSIGCFFSDRPSRGLFHFRETAGEAVGASGCTRHDRRNTPNR